MDQGSINYLIQQIHFFFKNLITEIFISVIVCDSIAGQTWIPTLLPTFMPTIPTGDCCESKLEYGETDQVMNLYLLSQNVGDIAKAGCMDGCVYVK